MPNFTAREKNPPSTMTKPDDGPPVCPTTYLSNMVDLAVRDAYDWQDFDLEHDFHEVETLPENDRVRYTISPALEPLSRRPAQGVGGMSPMAVASQAHC